MRGIAIILIIGLFTTSCSKRIAFTTDLRRKLEAQNIDIAKLQYYNSNQLILKRKLDSTEVKVAQGKVTYESGAYIEEIYINAKTPGVCEIKLDSDRLKISFEEGEGKNLTFGDLNPNSERYYILASAPWKGYTSKTKYQNQVYTVSSPNGIAYLEIAKSVIRKLKKEKRTAKGRKIVE